MEHVFLKIKREPPPLAPRHAGSSGVVLACESERDFDEALDHILAKSIFSMFVRCVGSLGLSTKISERSEPGEQSEPPWLVRGPL